MKKIHPVTVLFLGAVPALAASADVRAALGMSLAVLIVLLGSTLLLGLIRKLIPDEVRLPAYIVIVASLVTVTELLIEAYLPSVYEALGIYIPLIVVNCIILGRAEAFANKNKPLLSVMDGIGMGLGFTVALTLAGLVREVLGNGTAFGLRVLPKSVEPMGIFVQPPGAFLVIALFIIIMNAIGIKTRQKNLVDGCDGCCAKCMSSCQKALPVQEKKAEEVTE